ncbi:MAG: elongation factor 1-beta [Methanobrevibacter sp.]|jgi:elongation factor 1-beta|nr:elongation factor 1-beta [Candidatus Methanoflexus mossambicus]
MGEVAATVKLMPVDVDVDLDKIIETIKKVIPEELHSIEKEPIAFGLVALIVVFVVEDGEGGTEEVEKKLSDIEGISTVEITNTTRLM